jgi:hypothetical protein
MARGWESKSVEDQISAKEAERQNRNREASPAGELEIRAKREGLLLARTHTIAALESAKDERYRAMLQKALAHLDAQLDETPDTPGS